MSERNSAAEAMPPTPGEATRLAKRPYATAIITTLLWHALPLLALVAWTVVAVQARPAQSGEDWTGVILIVVWAVVGAAIVFGAGLGAAITAMLVGRRLRRAAQARQSGITARTAILLGSAGAGIGWLIGAVVAALMPMALSFVSTVTS